MKVMGVTFSGAHILICFAVRQSVTEKETEPIITYILCNLPVGEKWIVRKQRRKRVESIGNAILVGYEQEGAD